MRMRARLGRCTRARRGAILDRLLTYEHLHTQPPVHKGFGLLNHTDECELSPHWCMAWVPHILASRARRQQYSVGQWSYIGCERAISNSGLAPGAPRYLDTQSANTGVAGRGNTEALVNARPCRPWPGGSHPPAPAAARQGVPAPRGLRTPK